MLCRYIDTSEGKVPVGVFFKREDVVRATIVQLIELRKISTEPTSSDGRVVLKLLLNEGKLFHTGKSKFSDKLGKKKWR